MPEGAGNEGNDSTESSIVSLNTGDERISSPRWKPSTSNGVGTPNTEFINYKRTEADRPTERLGKCISGSSRWPKILISLSQKEKEEDLLAMKGTKHPQRLKRRSKQIEKVVQYVSPGAWLPYLTRDRYEVRERKAAKLVSRGLKEMDSMESDLE